MLTRGDLAFRQLVNDTLQDVYSSGEIDVLYAKWFTAPIPPNGINLNLPMSADLAKAFDEPVEYLE